MSYRVLDISNAFLNANLPKGTTSSSTVPERHPLFHRRGEIVLQIRRNLYGIKEGPEFWHRHLKQKLIRKLGLSQCDFEPCLFYYHDLMIAVYADDLLIMGSKDAIDLAIQRLKKEFKLTVSEMIAN